MVLSFALILASKQLLNRLRAFGARFDISHAVGDAAVTKSSIKLIECLAVLATRLGDACVPIATCNRP